LKYSVVQSVPFSMSNTICAHVKDVLRRYWNANEVQSLVYITV